MGTPQSHTGMSHLLALFSQKQVSTPQTTIPEGITMCQPTNKPTESPHTNTQQDIAMPSGSPSSSTTSAQSMCTTKAAFRQHVSMEGVPELEWCLNAIVQPQLEKDFEGIDCSNFT